jgi:ribosomal protein L13E
MKHAINGVIVKTMSNGKLFSRQGRGFSKNELIQSGVTDIRVARRLNLLIDPFRKSRHEENIEQLKALSKTQAPKNTKVNAKTVKKPTK